MATVFETSIRGTAWGTLTRLLGQSVTYKANGAGAGTAITAIWTPEQFDDSYYDAGERSISGGTIIASVTDVATPGLNDTFTIGGVVFSVNSVIHQTPFVEMKLVDVATVRIDGGMSRIKL